MKNVTEPKDCWCGEPATVFIQAEIEFETSQAQLEAVGLIPGEPIAPRPYGIFAQLCAEHLRQFQGRAA